MKKIICIILAASLIACGEKGTKGKRAEGGKEKQEQTASKTNAYAESIKEIRKQYKNAIYTLKQIEEPYRKIEPGHIDRKGREEIRNMFMAAMQEQYDGMKKEGLISGEEYEMKMLNLREEAKDLTSPDY